MLSWFNDFLTFEAVAIDIKVVSIGSVIVKGLHGVKAGLRETSDALDIYVGEVAVT